MFGRHSINNTSNTHTQGGRLSRNLSHRRSHLQELCDIAVLLTGGWRAVNCHEQQASHPMSGFRAGLSVQYVIASFGRVQQLLNSQHGLPPSIRRSFNGLLAWAARTLRAAKACSTVQQCRVQPACRFRGLATSLLDDAGHMSQTKLFERTSSEPGTASC